MSLDQLDCSAKVPKDPNETLAAAPCPERQPGAFVGVLLAVVRTARVVGPAAGRVLVGHHLVPFVPESHGPAVELPGATGVDEADAAAAARVHVVRLIAEGDVAVRRRDADVTVPVVPSTVRALVVVGVGAVGGQDHVVGVAVRCARRVAEVSRCGDRLLAELGGRCRGGGGLGVVVPHTREHTACLVRHEVGVRRAAGGAGGHVRPVAPLGQVRGPALVVGADALEHVLRSLGAVVGVAREAADPVVDRLGTPLRSVEHEIDLRVPTVDADAIDAPSVRQGLGTGGCEVGVLPRLHLRVGFQGRHCTVAVRVVVRRRVRVVRTGRVGRGCGHHSRGRDRRDGAESRHQRGAPASSERSHGVVLPGHLWVPALRPPG